MKKILYPARGLNRDRCIPLLRFRADLLALSYAGWMDYARSNLVVYLPQSGDRLRRAGRPWDAVFSRLTKL